MSTRYKEILDRMLTRDPSPSPERLAEYKAIAASFARKSSRHHYIPQHYIRGFVGDDRLLAVYDKELDIIKNRRVGPNGVFYEIDRNTTVLDNGMPISIIEDGLYAKFDTEFASCLRKFRELPIHTVINDFDNKHTLSAFIIDLFWRNPKADFAFKYLLDNSTVLFHDDKTGEKYRDPEEEQRYKNDPVMFKTQRARMLSVALNAIIEERGIPKQICQLRQSEQPMFVLGDYPILYDKNPSTHTDNLALSFFLPISSHRVYSRNQVDVGDFSIRDSLILNALIIHQSQKMVVAANRDILQDSVDFYKGLRNHVSMYEVKQEFFNGQCRWLSANAV